MANYIAKLQALSQNCNFGDTLELMLRDRIVCRINDVQTQKRLLVEKDLSFAKAKEIALGLESAVQGARDIQIPSSGTVHNAVEKKTTSYTKCFRCGRTNHAAPQCRYKDAGKAGLLCYPRVLIIRIGSRTWQLHTNVL